MLYIAFISGMRIHRLSAQGAEYRSIANDLFLCNRFWCIACNHGIVLFANCPEMSGYPFC